MEEILLRSGRVAFGSILVILFCKTPLAAMSIPFMIDDSSRVAKVLLSAVSDNSGEAYGSTLLYPLTLSDILRVSSGMRFRELPSTREPPDAAYRTIDCCLRFFARFSARSFLSRNLMAALPASIFFYCWVSKSSNYAVKSLRSSTLSVSESKFNGSLTDFTILDATFCYLNQSCTLYRYFS